MRLATNCRVVAVGVPVAFVAWHLSAPHDSTTAYARSELPRLTIDGATQQPPAQFGGSYSSLDARRRAYVDDWVARFIQVTGQKMEAESFYDTFIRVSTKTTFEAVTHAMMTTVLTDASGNRLGDALDLVERVDGVKGRVMGAASDRQFRMYVRLKEGALNTLAQSTEFRRSGDNTIYHKGYPTNFREQGGTPSIQISVASDGRRADIDVDYRSSGFPLAMFNGHLTASNSDVRAGNNYDRHAARWNGFQNWWQSFFGVRVPDEKEVERGDSSGPAPPRVGRKTIDAMAEDFLKAWLLEGDINAALSYVSPRASACLAEESDDPATFDRGMAPFVLAHRLKAAHDALGPHSSLESLLVGVRLTTPGLRLVKQPHHAQFVIYAVPDDVAAAFDCESRQSLITEKSVARTYGNYFGATFYIKGPQKPTSLALLWAQERGYWQIVSWQVEPEDDSDLPAVATPPTATPARIAAEASLVDAARRFLESWLVRKDYDTAFQFTSSRSYACYNLVRGSEQPAATSLEDAGRKIRVALEQSGGAVGNVRRLEDVLTAAPPFHPAVRVMDHRDSRTFTLSSVPDALADAADCTVRSEGGREISDVPPSYGNAFELTVRFRTRAGEPPVFRTMWTREGGVWRIAVYDVEAP
jgi:hypothetical protein